MLAAAALFTPFGRQGIVYYYATPTAANCVLFSSSNHSKLCPLLFLNGITENYTRTLKSLRVALQQLQEIYVLLGGCAEFNGFGKLYARLFIPYARHKTVSVLGSQALRGGNKKKDTAILIDAAGAGSGRNSRRKKMVTPARLAPKSRQAGNIGTILDPLFSWETAAGHDRTAQFRKPNSIPR